MDIAKKLFDQALELVIGPRPHTASSTTILTEHQLINEESKIGRHVFGPAPKGQRREFFCLDATTWIWHEEWYEPFTGQKKSTTVRYEVRPNGVLKTRDDQHSLFIEGEELDNLVEAAKIYFERVITEVYRYNPHTGLPLATTQAQPVSSQSSL